MLVEQTFRNDWSTNIIQFLPQVRPEVEITLEKGNSQVEGLAVLLVQEMVYICNMDQEDEVRKKEVQVMAEWKSEEKVGQGDTRKFNDIKILISKDLPITGFPHLDLIDVGYYIHAVAKVETGYLVGGK